MVFIGHSSTHGHLTGLGKADQSTFGSGVVVNSYFIDEAINMQWNKNSSPLCDYVAGFGKAYHFYPVVKTHKMGWFQLSASTS